MSYRITIDGQPFCSSNFEHSQLLNPKVTLEVNKSGSLSFVMMPDHPYYDEIEFRQNIFDVYLNDELIFEGIPVSEATDFWNRKTVVCEGELTFLNDTIQRQAVYRNQSVQSLLGEYLTVHNNQADLTKQFSTGIVTVTGGNSIFRYTNFQTTMKELQEDLIQNFGGYFRVRHSGGVRYLDYLDSSPHSSSQTIRIGKNLVDLSQNLSSLDICTVLIPLGAKTGNQLIDGLDERLTIKSVNNNKDYLVGTAQAYYGNVWATQTWDDVTTASALKSKGQEFLDDVQWSNLVISATAFDLGLATEDVEQFHVLDMIRVISEPHGIDRYFLLSKLDIDLDHPANTKIQLGEDKRLSLSARSAKLSDDIERQATSIQVSASENARMILDNATDGAIQILYNQDRVAYELRINNSQNPDTATKWWRYNSGGWGFTADGGQTYTTAATNDGTIFATLIKAGILSSDNGKFYVNLDTGAATLSDLTLTGGSINLNNGVFSVTDQGALTATSGNIGNWSIDSTKLYKTATAIIHTFDVLDIARMIGVINGQLDEATVLAQYPYYDLDGDGHITRFDVELCVDGILGVIPNGSISSSTTQLYPSKVYGSVSSISDMANGIGFVAGAFGVWGTGLLGKALSLTDTIGSSSDNKTYLIPEQGLTMNFTSSYTDPQGNVWYTHFKSISIRRGGINLTLNDANNSRISIEPTVVSTW